MRFLFILRSFLESCRGSMKKSRKIEKSHKMTARSFPVYCHLNAFAMRSAASRGSISVLSMRK